MKTIGALLLPKAIDNDFRGHKVALWLFGFYIALRTLMGVNSIVMTHKIATTADGIAVDTFPAAAAQAVLGLFAFLALAHLSVCIIGAIALIRYRAMVPMLFALLLFQQIAGQFLAQVRPIIPSAAPAADTIHAIQIGVVVIGLALSLWNRRGVAA